MVLIEMSSDVRDLEENRDFHNLVEAVWARLRHDPRLDISGFNVDNFLEDFRFRARSGIAKGIIAQIQRQIGDVYLAPRVAIAIPGQEPYRPKGGSCRHG